MNESTRLACPRCELVYRLKKTIPGRVHSCKNCGGPLLPAETVATRGEGGTAALSGRAADIQRGPAPGAAGLPPESDLSRLPKLVEQLARRIDAMNGLEGETGPGERLIAMNERLEHDLRDFAEAIALRLNELDERVTADIGGEMKKGLDGLDEKIAAAMTDAAGDMRSAVSGLVGGVEEKISELSARSADSFNRIDELKAAMARQQESLAGALGEYREAQRRDLEAVRESQKRELTTHRESQKQAILDLLAPLASQAGNTTVEVDIDELADRLVAGVRGKGPFLDPDSGSAVDAMARLADELVREQSANTARLDRLAEEIRSATVGISKIDEWRGELPERVADEIGQTVEARVVGPISDTLTRQAPALLAELHDNKLIDLVSRSVREAQRPLLREILAGGRRGVPLWLFASVLLPLMLILGYLFLPGDYVGRPAEAAAPDEATEAIARVEAGVLANIEETVYDIHSEAMAHVKNAAVLEEEVKNLRATLAERDKLIVDYKDTLQIQVKRMREYEMRLVQLGVTPKAINE